MSQAFSDYFERADKGKDFTVTTRKGNEIYFKFINGRYEYTSNANNEKYEITIDGVKQILLAICQDFPGYYKKEIL